MELRELRFYQIRNFKIEFLYTKVYGVNQTELQITKLSFFKRSYRKYISIKSQNSIRLRESARNEFPPNSEFYNSIPLNGTARIKFLSKIQVSKRNFSK